MMRFLPALAAVLAMTTVVAPAPAIHLEPEPGDHICIIGNTLPERMQHDGYLETLLHARFPGHELVVRNLAFSGDEVAVRLRSDGFGSPDDHLSAQRADIILAFFGFNESFTGTEGLEKFRADLDNFIEHTLAQKYNGESPSRLVLFSPIAHEDLKNTDLPDGSENNARLTAYTAALAEVAEARGVPFVNLFAPSRRLYEEADEPLTINGVHLNESGNRRLAPVIEEALFGPRPDPIDWAALEPLRKAILDKNFHWFHRYRTTDGYSTYGGRADLAFVGGQTNREVLRRELEVLDVLTANRDARIWAVARGQDLTIDDTNTPPFLPVQTNKPGEGPNGEHIYLGGAEAIDKMTAGPGMKVELVASEEDFPELINPVQMAFDTKGRLWVATWPSYPHWKPKTAMDDRLLILHDDDGDGRADRCTTFADGLHNPTGFEFYGKGVLVANAPYLLYLEDTDGDDRADIRTRVLGGLDTADTHHTANSFTLDPGGALYFQEGTFHRTQAETPYGPQRNLNACVWRFEPRTGRLERYVPFDFANPHGHVFGRWGEDYITDGTGAQTYHASLFSGHLDFPAKHPKPPQLYQQRTRPCPGIEILSSRHFPEENQGNLLVGNVIGFAGILQYRIEEKGSSFTGTEVEPVVFSSDPNFRPVDLEIGPDGALYFTDWQNPVIGHMQHNLRDPSRDQTHGRVYRVVHEGRPLLEPELIAGQSLPALLERLKSPEDRVRYRARIELAGRATEEVLAAVDAWVAGLDPADPDHAHQLTEALWVKQVHNRIDEALLRRLLRSPDHNARAAATRVLCYGRRQVSDPLALLAVQAEDEHPRVRLEAVRACSFLDDPRAAEVALLSLKYPMDEPLTYVLGETMRQLEPRWKSAIAAGTPLAADNPAGIDFLLGRVSTAELVKLPRTERVYQALLSRPQVPPQYRREALEALARLHGTTLPVELVAAIERIDQGDEGQGRQVLPELAHLLFEGHHPTDGSHAAHHGTGDLASVRDRLAALAEGARQGFTRQVATVALMTADGHLDPTWQRAAGSLGSLRDLLDAVPLIPDADLRARAHERLVPLVSGLPETLVQDGDAARGTVGRYVRVELPGRGTLTLAEVEVYSDGRNIAPTGKATQSSVSHGGVPTRAIDGNTSGVYGDGGQTHTHENAPAPWWELDLGAGRPIDGIVVWNRTEGSLGKRLDGFRIAVLDADRRVIFEQAGVPAPSERLRFDLEGDPAGSVRRAAIAALVSTGVDPEGTFRRLAGLARSGDERTAAIQALGRIPRSAWPRGEVKPLFEAIVADVEALPASERTTPAARAAFELGHELAALLPGAEAAQARRLLRELGVPVHVLRPVPHLILFDKTRLYVEAGRPVEIVFENLDLMPHNLLVLQPGALQRIGLEAEKMAADPNAFARNFVPERPEVLHATPLLQPGQVARLTFNAPQTPGEYPYVCTFPGHWQRMNGVLHVVESLDDVPSEMLLAAPTMTDAAPALRPFVRAWTLADLENSLGGLGHSRRDARRGEALFRELACAQCHRVDGQPGGGVGPDLAEVRRLVTAGQRQPLDLLSSLVEPSKQIEELYRTNVVALADGTIVSGVVVEEADGVLTLRANPLEGATVEPIKIPLDEIEERVVSQVSVMPEGLLNTLSEEEVLDLLSYLISGGPLTTPAGGHGQSHGEHP